MSSDSRQRTPEETLALAEKILLYSRRFITQEAPLMLAPIYALRQEPLPLPGPMATDGARLFYSPQQVIDDFQGDRSAPARQLLHTTLHCLLGHVPARPQAEGDQAALFDALADLKAAQFADALSHTLCPSRKGNVRAFTQRPLPAALERMGADPDAAKNLTGNVSYMGLRLDSHALWSPPGGPGPGGSGGGDGKEAEGPAVPGALAAGAGTGPAGEAPDWHGMLQEMAQRAGSSSSWGNLAGILQAEYFPAEENRISYSDFLRRFAVPEERLLLDPDSFDPRWYYLGLEQYGNIPLLEPAELSEPPLPDDIVLALDTSGSCSGEVCRRFLRETLSLLRDISAGAPRFRVLALQCDTEIQKEILLESADQLDGFLEDFAPRGFGGTSFCPVFERVERLREEGTLPRVRGLLYLSDGYGDFPEAPPDYPVTFLLLNENDLFGGPQLPAWVSALTLNANDFTLKEASE